MANLTRIPGIDDFETQLSSSYTGGLGTVSVNSVPSGTIESGETSYIVINPGKSNMQVVEIDGWNSGTSSFNVVSITVEKGNGVNYSAQTHAANSIVRFSNNYAFWKDIRTAVNSKAEVAAPTFTGYVGLPTYADATARNVAIPTPTGKELVIVNGDIQHYNSTTAQRETADTGTPTPNASETVAGKVEKATQTEVNAGTSTGGTGAELFVGPAELISFASGITVPDASTTVKGKIEIATDSEVTTGTSTVLAVTPSGLPKTAILQTTRASDAASGSVTIAHGLSRVPKYIQITGIALTSTDEIGGTSIHSVGYSDGTNNKCSYVGLIDGGSSGQLSVGNSTNACIHFALGSSSASRLQTATASFDATNVTLVWTYNGLSGTTGTMNITILAVA